jgi:Rrf2 family protein
MLGIHAMACMARGGPRQSVTAAALAERLGVSEAHLGKVLQRLAKQNLLHSRKGPIGGFALARPPQAILLLEILEAIDGPCHEGQCCIGGHTPGACGCLIDRLLRAVHDEVHQSLAGTTLADGAICLPAEDSGDPRLPAVAEA